MSLRPQIVPPVPEEIACIARADFPKGNFYMQIRDEVGVLLTDVDFADLFPSRGKAAYSPWRLALITIFQFDSCVTAVRGINRLECVIEAMRNTLKSLFKFSRSELFEHNSDHRQIESFFGLNSRAFIR